MEAVGKGHIMAFIKDPKTKKTLWVPKPKTPEQHKAGSTDKRAAELAKRTPTSGKQTIMQGQSET